MKKKTWNVESDDRRKRKDKRKKKNKSVFEKRVWGGGGREKRNRTFLELPETLFSVALITTPRLKNPRIARKTALVVIISKQNNRHKHKKGKSTKKN